MTTARTPVLLDPSGTRTYSQVAELRSGAPATWVRLPGDLTAWSVTRGDLVRRLVTDPRVSRNPRKHWPGFTDTGQPGWLVPWTPASMFNADGADHTRLRKLISRAFTPRQIDALRPAITHIVTTLLDACRPSPPARSSICVPGSPTRSRSRSSATCSACRWVSARGCSVSSTV